MVDPFILGQLGNPRTIGDREYLVSWVPRQHKAFILYVEDNKLHDLLDSEGNPMSFTCEMEAYTYLNGLYFEEYGPVDESWRDL